MSRNNNTRNTIPVFFAVDDIYAPYLAVALRSITENAKGSENIIAYILIEELSQTNRDKLLSLECEKLSIEFVPVSEKLQTMGVSLHLRDYYTAATYYRFFIPEMFPEYDKGLYLDCDITVTGDIAELFNTELGDNLIGAVTDEVITDIPIFTDYAQQFLGVEKQNYFNAGILVMNLKELRRINIEKALASLMERYEFTVAQDQDYLNILCSGRTKYLDQKWNKTAFPGCDRKKVPAIVHFKINWKPWHYKNVAFEEYFWRYAEKTPYYNQLLKQREKYSERERKRDASQYEGLKALAESEIKKAQSPDYILPIKYSVLAGEVQ